MQLCAGQQRFRDEAGPSAPPPSEEAGSPVYDGDAARPSGSAYSATDPAALERLQRQRPAILADKARSCLASKTCCPWFLSLSA